MDAPTLTEADARRLTRAIVERLRALGGRPTRFGLSLTREGFSFTAELHGRQITVQTGQGSFTYDAIAKELLARAVMPFEWGEQIYKLEAPGQLPKFSTH
jgi:hypothetical protein